MRNLNSLLEDIRNGIIINNNELAEYLMVPQKSARIETCVRLAEAFEKLEDTESSKRAAIFIERAWLLSGFEDEILPLLIKIYEKRNKIEKIKEAYKSIGLKKANEGKVVEALSHFNSWQLTYPEFSQKDKYEYDSQIMEAVDKLAQPFKFGELQPAKDLNGRKIKVAVLLKGFVEPNSVIVKMNKLFIEHHDKGKFEFAFFVHENEKDVLQVKHTKELIEYFEEKGCKLLISKGESKLEGLLYIRDRIVEFGADILVVNDVLANFNNYFISRLNTTPKSVCIMFGPPYLSAWPTFDHAIAWFPHQVPDSPLDTSIVPLEVSLDSISNTEPVLKNSLKIPDESILLVTGGRSTKYQNSLYWQSIIDFLEKNESVFFLALGFEKKDIPSLREINDAHVLTRLKFVKWTEDYAKYLAVGDIFLDSFPVGGGVILFEANALGIPAVSFHNHYLSGYDSSDVSAGIINFAIPELLVDRHDFDGMKKKIKYLIDNPQYRKKMGNKCKEYVLAERSDPKRMVKRCEKIYLDVLGLDSSTTVASSNHENKIKITENHNTNKIETGYNEMTQTDRIPFFTVVIPVYNHGEYLPAALDSVIAQSFDDWEIVCINDGSTDNTQQVIDEYVKKDSRIRGFHKTNGGVSSALNEGIRQARGEWICWLSSDDLFEPDKLEIHRKEIDENPGFKFHISMWSYLLNDTGQKIKAKLWEPIPEDHFRILHLFNANYIHGNSIAIHRTVLDDIGLFDEKLLQGQDFDLWLRILLKYKFHFIPERTCVTRIHDNQTTHSFSEGGVFDSTYSLIKNCEGLSYPQLFPGYKLDNLEKALKVIIETLAVTIKKDAFIHRLHPSDFLVLKIAEWLKDRCPAHFRGSLKKRLRNIVSNLIREHSGNATILFLDKYLNGSSIIVPKYGFIDNTISYAETLIKKGDQKKALEVERFLQRSNDRGYSIWKERSDYKPVLFGYQNNADILPLTYANIIDWRILPSPQKPDSVKHYTMQKCPECGTDFLYSFTHKLEYKEQSTSYNCPVCKKNLELNESEFEEFILTRQNAVKRTERKISRVSRIAFFVRTPGYVGGGNKVLFNHINWLNQLGAETIIYSFEEGPDWMKLEADYNVIKNINQIDPTKFDYIISFSVFEIPEFLKIVDSSRVYLLCQGYEGYHYGSDYESIRADKYVLEMLHALPYNVIVVSTHLKELFKEKFNKDALYVPNGINHEIFNTDNIPVSKKPEVCFIGNPFHILKGFAFLITALDKIQNSKYRIDDLTLNLIIGLKSEEVEEWAKSLSRNVNIKVNLYSKLKAEEVATVIKRSKVLVCSSIYEGFSIPLLEAMASGTPVITTNNMGAESFCESEKNSFVVEYNDYTSLLEKLYTVLTDKIEKSIIESGKVTAAEYDEANTVANLINVYNTITGSIFDPHKVKKLMGRYELDTQDLADRKTIEDSVGECLISFVIPTYDKLEMLKDCVSSIVKNTNSPFEIIVIDDFSAENIKQGLSQFENVRVIRNPENLGFPKSVNKGVKIAGGDYIFIVNNDTLCTAGSIERLVNLAEEHEDVGLIGVMSNYAGGVQLVKDVPYTTIDDMHSFAKFYSEQNRDKFRIFPSVSFLFTLLKKEVVEKVGALDERYTPGYFEDDDYCLRVQLAGYKTAIAEDVFIHHFGSATFRDRYDKEKDSLYNASKEKFVEKWGGSPEEIWIEGKQVSNGSYYIPFERDQSTAKIKAALDELEQKNFDNAIKLLEQILESNAGCEEIAGIDLNDIYNLLGQASFYTGDLEKSRKYYELLLQRDEKSAIACIGLARIFNRSGMTDEAGVMLNWALKIDPENKEANSLLNDIYIDHGEVSNINGLLNEAEKLINSGNLSEAEDILRRILDLRPNNLDALNNITVVNIIRKNYEEALCLLDRVISLDPENEIALGNFKFIEEVLTERSSKLEA